MSRKPFGPEFKNEMEARLARLESALWGFAWLLGAMCAAMLLAYAWVAIRGHFLDAEMDVVSASLGAG